MSADDDEPEAPADGGPDPAAVADDGPTTRQPPGPDDRPIADLPPPDGDGAEVVDAAVEERRVEAELGRLGSWLEPDEEQEATAADALGEPELWPGSSEAPEAPEALDVPEAPEVPVAPEVPEAPEIPEAAEAPQAQAEVAPEGEVAEPEPAPVPAPDPARKRSRRRPRLLVALLVISVVSTAFAVAKTQEANDLRAQRDDRRAIEVVAARFGSAYLSYDFAHVEESGRAVTALGTSRFSRSYAADRAPGIQQLFTSRQTTTRAKTTEVFVGSVGRRTARALVVVDVTATSPTEGEQRLDDVSFVLDLARTAVGWRVDQVDRAPQASLAEEAPAPAS